MQNIQSRFPAKKVYWLPNGVDLNFYNFENNAQQWRNKNGFSSADFILLYAGIIGHAQGLEVILKAAVQVKNNPIIKFVIVGSGPEKEKLIQLKSDLQLDHVFFFDAVSKSHMPEIVAAADVSIIPLKKLDLFKGAIPSKIFEILAMKKPILLGVEGEAKELFITEGNCGLAFEPENYTDLTAKINTLFNNKELLDTFGNNGYMYVKQKFTRDSIAENFWNFLTTDSNEQK